MQEAVNIREHLREEEANMEVQSLLTFIRSRLNIISTSLYLLESALSPTNLEARKYIHKINREIESIRKFING